MDLSIEFLRENKDRLNWRHVLRNRGLSIDELREFSEYIDWHLYFILQYQERNNNDEV